jgi:hypothetical protein
MAISQDSHGKAHLDARRKVPSSVVAQVQDKAISALPFQIPKSLEEEVRSLLVERGDADVAKVLASTHGWVNAATQLLLHCNYLDLLPAGTAATSGLPYLCKL